MIASSCSICRWAAGCCAGLPWRRKCLASGEFAQPAGLGMPVRYVERWSRGAMRPSSKAQSAASCTALSMASGCARSRPATSSPLRRCAPPTPGIRRRSSRCRCGRGSRPSRSRADDDPARRSVRRSWRRRGAGIGRRSPPTTALRSSSSRQTRRGEFDDDVVAAETLDQFIECSTCGFGPTTVECSAHRPLRHPVRINQSPVCPFDDKFVRGCSAAALSPSPRYVCGRDRP